MLMLRWLGIEPGESDYPRLHLQCNGFVSMNMEAKVVMIDVKEDFTIDPEKYEAAAPLALFVNEFKYSCI